jgi:hypothetical protein
MNISEDIKQASSALSSCNGSFLDFITNNPDGLSRSHFKQVVELSNLQDCRFQAWPVFIDRDKRKQLQNASEQVFDLITQIPRRVFQYNAFKMSQYYEIPLDNMEMFLYGVDDTYLKNFISRGDFIFTQSGGLKCVEFNMTSNLGGWEMDLMQPKYANVPIISQFLKTHDVKVKKSRFFDTIFGHFVREGMTRLKDSFGNKMELNMAIAYPAMAVHEKTDFDNQLKMLFRRKLMEVDKRFTGDLFFCQQEHLEPGKDGLMLDGQRIHVLLELSNGRIPVQVMEKVFLHKLLVFNGPVSWLMTNKLNLALLSTYQDSDIFSAGEREIIAKYIPWTRKMTPGKSKYEGREVPLEEFVRSNKDRLVLKPASGIGGKGVCVGCYVSSEQWQGVVEEAFKKKNWLVQEYLESATYMFQKGDSGCCKHNAVWGLFVFGRSTGYAGGFLRLLPLDEGNGVINYHQGAEETIIIEVE